MRQRLVISLFALLIVKGVIAFGLAGSFTETLVFILTLVDMAAVFVLGPWVALGRPVPPRSGMVKRAFVAGALTTWGLALTNVVPQIPMIVRLYDFSIFGTIVGMLLLAIPRSTIFGAIMVCSAGPLPAWIGGVPVWLISSAVNCGMLSLLIARAGCGHANGKFSDGRPTTSARCCSPCNTRPSPSPAWTTLRDALRSSHPSSDTMEQMRDANMPGLVSNFDEHPRIASCQVEEQRTYIFQVANFSPVSINDQIQQKRNSQ